MLVLDSGDPDVRAAETLSRDLGHLVFTHPSPVGVAGALGRYHIDVVLLGWHLGAEQDAKLLTLLESWERLRALKIVLLARSRHAELRVMLAAGHDAAVVSVESMDSELRGVLGQPSREFESVQSMWPEGSHFVHRLRARLLAATQCWEGIAQGSVNAREIEFPLVAANGQAQLLQFNRLGELIDEVTKVTRECEQSGRPSAEQYEAVTAALRFAIHVTMAPYDADRDTSPILRRLRRSRPQG